MARNHFGDGFADAPAVQQCLLIYSPEDRPFTAPYRRCRGWRSKDSDFCFRHKDLPIIVAELVSEET